MRGFNAIKFIMRSSDANAIGSVSAYGSAQSQPTYNDNIWWTISLGWNQAESYKATYTAGGYREEQVRSIAEGYYWRWVEVKKVTDYPATSTPINETGRYTDTSIAIQYLNRYSSSTNLALYKHYWAWNGSCNL